MVPMMNVSDPMTIRTVVNKTDKSFKAKHMGAKPERVMSAHLRLRDDL